MNDKYIVYFISRTKKKMIRFIEKKLHQNGMNDLIPSHGNILTALYENNERLTMKKIAEIIGKDKSTVTPLVNKLLSIGYIKKEKDENDKRITYITLTDKGREIETKYSTFQVKYIKLLIKIFHKRRRKYFLNF